MRTLNEAVRQRILCELHPTEAVTKPAAWSNYVTGDLCFGTLRLVSRAQFRRVVPRQESIGYGVATYSSYRPSSGTTSLPELAHRYAIPEDWRWTCGTIPEPYNVAALEVFGLSKLHGWTLSGSSDRLSGTYQRAGQLVSTILAYGEAPTWRNFQVWLKCRGMKYLPLTFGCRDHQLWIYDPTPDRLDRAIANFEQALAIVAELKQEIVAAIQKLFVLDRFQGHRNESTLMPAVVSDVEKQLREMVEPLRNRLGFLLADVPGPKDTPWFSRDYFDR